MTTFIKAKLKKSDDQTNIDKYRVPNKYRVLNIYDIKYYENSDFKIFKQ